ncbi:thioredoxin-dependent thiol peroxidase [uncultured Microbacterium sp.]|uniref:thioredoxin-dependent thiol peroxidase n=1 Tax=uncultured Microbacterium sp. TaxID=191216 RepID=UPI0025DFE6D8|nr:thioredoxin-dependent thiol peroxidase [uncultured Microbacterium sp.]
MTEQHPATPRLEPGETAPDFSLHDQNGATVSLHDLRGQRVVLYFYPAAMTPGCTTEACDFRDSLSSLQAAGVAVVGVSRDEPAKLKQFAERDGLTFPLLSDPDLAVHRLYGVWGEKKNYGKVVQGVIRSTFLIDPDGIVEQSLYNVKATGHVARIRKLLGLAA